MKMLKQIQILQNSFLSVWKIGLVLPTEGLRTNNWDTLGMLRICALSYPGIDHSKLALKCHHHKGKADRKGNSGRCGKHSIR